jgi:hypothetical protein
MPCGLGIYQCFGETYCLHVRFKVLMVACMKMTAFWDVALYSLVEVDWRFIALMMAVVRTSETSVYFSETAQRYIPESCPLHTVSILRAEVKLWYLLISPHSVITQKANINIFTATSTSHIIVHRIFHQSGSDKAIYIFCALP